MNLQQKKLARRAKIRRGIRIKLSGTAAQPRLSVFRSNKDIYAQLVNDLTGTTIASASSRAISDKTPKIDKSKLVGKAIAEKAVALGVTKVTFDRGGYLYHGRVKSLADGAREGGLQF
jgi:large subunit ribosomal protein L18